jgi:serine/threonine-protein kinase
MSDERGEGVPVAAPDAQTTWQELLGSNLAPGDVLAEKYRLDELVGKGAMGFVVRAWHLQLDEPVAVKFLLPELVESEEALARFEREARAAFKIKSEHVSRVLDVGRVDEGAPFMVMEFLQGRDLAEILDERGALPSQEAVDYLLQACEAIAEAHELGIVHRDLKPENLFVVTRNDGSACVKVLDFGLSKLLPTGSGERPRALTSHQQVMGTAQYMSPEQWMSTKDVGPSTDIWSLGIILYELVSEHSPFLRDKMAQMCNAVLREPLPPLDATRAGLPSGLAEVVARCAAKQAADRYANVGELALALAPFASPSGATLAARIARRVAQGMTSDPQPSQPELPISRPAPKSSPAVLALPRLGLQGPGGIVESWAELIHEESHTTSRRPLAIGAALIVVALIVLGLAWTSGAPDTPAPASAPR